VAGALVVVVQFRAKPGQEGAAEAAFDDAIRATHAEEGCIRFALHRVPDEAGRYVLVECWASRAALDEHLATPHIAEFRARGAEIWAEPPQLTVAEALPVGDLAKGILAA
jgi:quinol monooxygenase YgiN